MPRESPKKVVAREAFVILAYFVAASIATYPLIIRFDGAVPPGRDTWLYYWNLWWVKRALVDLHVTPFFTPDLYFPDGTSLYFHTLNLLPGVLALPFASTVGVTAAYNFVVFMAFTLSGYAMYRLTLYVLAREIDPNAVSHHASTARLAAFLAGLTFAFSSYQFAHLHGHLDLVSTEWLPFFVLFLLKTRDERKWSNPILCGVFLAAAALTTAYYMMLLLAFTAMLLVHVLVSRGRDAVPVARRIAVALAVFALLTSPVLIPMLILGRTAGRSLDPARDIATFSTDALAFVVPSPLHPIWGDRVTALYQRIFGKSAGFEHVAFLGYVPLLLASVAVWQYRATRTFWLVGLLVFSLLALGPIAHIAGRAVPALSAAMPYRFIVRLPYGDIPRVPVRFVVMAILCLSVLAGCGAWFILRKRSGLVACILTAAAAALVLFENAAVPLAVVPVEVPPFFDRLARDPSRSAVLEVPIPDDPAVIPQRMLFQTRHGKPIYGGYLARGAPTLQFGSAPGFAQFKALSPTIDDLVSYDARLLPAISRQTLRAYGAGHVVIEKSFMAKPELVDRAREIADELFGKSAREYEDSSTLAYAVPRDQQPGPSAVWLDTGWSYLERLDQQNAEPALRWRWMGERARVAVSADEPKTIQLKLTAMAFDRLRHLKLSIGDAEITTLPIARDRSDYETLPFRVPAGLTFLDLRSLEGAESPGVDPRHLSVALFRIELVESQ